MIKKYFITPPSGQYIRNLKNHFENVSKLNNRMLQMVSRTGNIQDHKQEQLRMQKEHLEQSKKQMENTDLQYMHPDQVQKYQGNVLHLACDKSVRFSVHNTPITYLGARNKTFFRKIRRKN